MNTRYQNTDDPIVALATPYAESAIAVIRCAGTGSIERVAQCFSQPERLVSAAGNTTLVGYFLHPQSRERIDQVVCSIFRAPHSYTGEDAVEVNCHGSLPGIDACVEALRSAGFRPAEPGEFTLRAFLAGKLGLTQAEAVGEIVRAQTRTAQTLALSRLSGRLEQRIENIKQSLIGVLSTVEIQLDYPEEDTGAIPVDHARLAGARRLLEELASTYRTGSMYQNGVRVALAGATNAGKSSLFNALVRTDRSIVSDVHGTTRDYIEASVSVHGIPVRLFDTAGLRETAESVESEGIRRSAEVVESSAAVVYLVDAVEGVSDADTSALSGLREKKAVVPVWNKIDLLSGPRTQPASTPDGFVAVSAGTGEGIDELLEAVFGAISGTHTALAGNEVVVDSARQFDLLQRAIDALGNCLESVGAQMPADVVAVDLQDAVGALGEITGEVTTDDILEAMFGGFCVGK